MSLLMALALGTAPLTCGAATMPGVAEQAEDGTWRGTAVAACARIASVIRGGAMTFHPNDRPGDGETDDIQFVTDAALATAGGQLLAGPVIATDRQVLVARDRPGAPQAGDLVDSMICFIVGSRAETALNQWASQSHLPIERLAFQEPIELRDAYEVGKCAAMAVDAAELPTGLGDRIVATLAETPIRIATPAARGPDWQRAVRAAIEMK